jgi:hypothetical protein
MRVLAIALCLLCACATTEDAPGSGPGPKRALPPDEALHAAPARALEGKELEGWVAERVARAKSGAAERVRVPLTARPQFSEGAPFGLAKGLPFPEGARVVVRDLTSVGIQIGADGWLGWVEGRFTGELEVGGPVLEVLRQSPRRPEEAAVFQVVSPTE